MPYAPPRPHDPKSGLFKSHAKQPAKRLLLGAMLALVFGAGSAAAQDQDVRLTGTFGVGYSNGSYGTERNTDVLLALSTLGAEMGDFDFNISIPYMRISGRGLV